MRTYQCLIIEDEPLAAEILVDYIAQVPFLQLKAVCSDALFAISQMNKEKIDLIFLDIHLPKLKGLDFLKSLREPPAVIITTAYHEYALQGYEHNVVDYLLKPIELSRFLAAVNKLNSPDPDRQESSWTESDKNRKHLFFNVGKKKVKVFVDEILYIESLKEYICIVTKEKSVLTKFNMSDIESLLDRSEFLRVHRSFIIAKNKIEAFTATDIEINKKLIPIGRSYKEMIALAIK